MLFDKKIIFSLVSTICILSTIILSLGVNPLDVLIALLKGSVGNNYFLKQTLMTSGILMLTALAAVIPFSARLWNLGAEGQMILGAATASYLGVFLVDRMPVLLSFGTIILFSFLTGALISSFCGFLKVKFNASEVVSTLMVNFIALSVSAWMIFELIPAKMVQRTISIGKEFRIEDPVSIYLNPVFITGILCCVLLYFIMTRTKYGFQTRAMGSNIYASKLSGINPSIITVITFFFAGGFAALAGTLIILARDFSLLLNFSSNYGYLGIGVALVARLNPLAVIPIAFIFAMLSVGSNSLQAITGISPMIGNVFVAMLVLSLMFFKVIRFKYPENING